MNRGSDVIILTDCRLSKGIEKIRRIMRLGKTTSYNLYANSTRGDRGVCIAINRDRNVEIIEEIKERVHENYLLLHCKIDQKEMLIGGVYGPNSNNRDFYRELIGTVERFNIPTILGGDWNTVISGEVGVENLDLEDRDNIPQKENGRILREWIEGGNYCEPFRRKYPMANTMSYKPFRTRRRVGDRWETVNYGQSRLDFFIMSECLYSDVESVYYGERLSRDFDHVEAVLRLGKGRKGKETVHIRNDILDRPEIEEIGVLGALDCISNHLERPCERLRQSVGMLEQIYVNKSNSRRSITLNLVDDIEAEKERLNQLDVEWNAIVRRVGKVEEWAKEDVSCSRATLYEVLLNEYKNRIIALQGGIDRDNKYKREWLLSRRKVYEEIYGKGSVQYKESEDDILQHDSERLKEDTSKYMQFLRENNEKPTRKFCKLGKNTNTVDDIRQIQKPGGGEFRTDEERAEYVRSFYANLYKKKIDRVIEIENFFTEDEWTKVRDEGRKLDEGVKESLEGEITLEELTKSMKSSNLSSCPGWDGISYKCLSKLWEYIKIPLLNMANESFEKGELSPTLRTALIKLIPKGKNNSKVGDWRPISLLPTSYKIISGVVALRLEIALPHIIGRAQKGFLKYKNMGTVIHNVIDGMASSWEEKDQMGILLVDFVKAFDSVEHEYIRKCMAHFNFGERITGMVMTLLNRRRACINLGNMYSKYFEIGRGTPQGDRASPYIFIICVEILIIKIEHGGGGVICGRKALDKLGHDINSLCEAFADDLTVLFKLRGNALRGILDILDGFSVLSGLAINREKTHIMISGREWEGGDTIEGISVKKECRLLGVILDNKLENLQCNWEMRINKISGLINFWNQYNLTITGRVLVAKTFLLSQVTFLMGLIKLNQETADRIERLIERYVLGKLQVARDRIYNTVEQGGIGLIKISELDTAIGCAWINRWKKEGTRVDITGGRVLTAARNNNIELINKDLINSKKYPCARRIGEMWHTFRSKYYENDANLYQGTIFSNPGLRNRMGEMIGGHSIFSQMRYENIRELFWDIKVGQLVDENGIRNKEEVELILGTAITGTEYGKLRGGIKFILNKYKPSWELKSLGKEIIEWIAPIKRGSGRFRNIMSGRGSRVYRKFKFDDIRPIRTLWEQMQIDIDEPLVKSGMLLWQIRETDTDFRQFTFKWNQGMVQGNTVISHFGDVDRRCTFCKIKKQVELTRELGREPTTLELNNAQVPDENRPHIFWDCMTVQTVIQRVHNAIWETGNVNKKDFLMGRNLGILEVTMVYMLVNMFIKYKIWKYKLAGVLPNENNILRDVRYWIENLCAYKKWRMMLALVRQLWDA